jgi:outer membrane receptor protein involved in Fe transport
MGTGVNDANLAAGAFEYLTAGGQFQDGLIEQTTESASIGGEPFSVPAGPVSLSASFEHRTDKINAVVDEFSRTSQRTGSNYGPLKGQQSVTEGALETIIPLAKDAKFARSWDLSLAARSTDYEYSGPVTTYKIGTTYSPIDDIKFRVTHSRDIRAPNIQDLFAPAAGFSQALVDRVLNIQVPGRPFYTVEGNPDLKPEKADTIGVGIVVQPRFLPGFSASVDYWRVNIKDAIQPLQPQQVIDACFFNIAPSLCANTIRGADGNITSVLAFPINLATYDARGIDVESSYTMPMSDIAAGWRGDLSLRGFMTFYLKSYQDSVFAPPVDIAGSNFFGTSGAAANSLPDWKLNIAADYKLDRWSFSLAGRAFSDGTFNNNFVVCSSSCPPSTAANPTINANSVPGRVYVDAGVNYTFEFAQGSTANLFLSVKNVFDKDPPPLPSGANLATLYDVMGSVYRAGVRISW